MTGTQNWKANGTKLFGQGGYSVAAVGNVTEEAIKKYIQEQYEESKEEEGTAFER